MSYQKHTWVAKEIIKKAGLNHIEEGIYNEEERAIGVENSLAQQLNTEIQRATNEESSIGNRVTQNAMSIAEINANNGYRLIANHSAIDEPKDNIIYIKNNGGIYKLWIYQAGWIQIGG